MFNSPFKLEGNFAALVKRMTYTTDSNVFPPETNKVSNVGRLKPRKLWFVCDGNGSMYVRHVGDPIDQIRELGELLDKDLITSEEFEAAKKKLLDKID